MDCSETGQNEVIQFQQIWRGERQGTPDRAGRNRWAEQQRRKVSPHSFLLSSPLLYLEHHHWHVEVTGQCFQSENSKFARDFIPNSTSIAGSVDTNMYFNLQPTLSKCQG
ncbi:hypothetical protein PILCRDRAFT_827413 [Piloderma croceum F 1598]|uniref:Uncharacterized protein n=1 Tax=Piloderma croceum (strain F 1598) TaxID=765440 RepID=A0A0C3F5Z2_PILCF|nr:hypothetical protein PILCRDRAFT_827413 [Piloderma croceum F 1598]